MKKLSVFFTITILGLLLFACKEENETPEVQQSYRLKAWYDTGTYNYFNYRYEVNYEGEKVSYVLIYRNSAILYKDVWTYDGNMIYIESVSYSDTGWSEPHFKRELTFNDEGKLIKAYTPGMYINNVYIYHWEGDRVISQEIGNYSINYSYDNDKLTGMSYVRISDDFSFGYERLDYNSDKVSEMTYWFIDTTSKIKFTYQDAKLYQINKTDPSQIQRTWTETYTFDNNGNLSQISANRDGSTRSHITFVEYEPGKGNFDQYWLYRHGWLVVYLYPNMIPSEFAHGTFSNYGLNERLLY
ncbi:MAG: hypothetical protein ACM3ME_09195 [Chloroflexota bacterium]